MSDVWPVLVGLVVGVLISYSGVGAGALVTPLLILLAGVRPELAIGSDLVFALVTKLAAFAAHLRGGTINRSLLFALAPGGIAGAVAGVAMSHLLHDSLPLDLFDRVLRVALGCVLLVAAVAIMTVRRADAGAGVAAALPRASLFGIGAVVGCTVALTSVGAGSLTLPLLLLVVPQLSARKLVGTDVAFAVIVLAPSIAGHLSLRDVDPGLVGLLLLGSIPGVFLGARFVKSVPDRVFRSGLAAVMTLVAVLTLR